MASLIARPPGPKNPPIVGNLIPFRGNPLVYLTNVARRYGDIVYFQVMKQHMYVLSHPDFVREVLVTNQNNFVKSRALERAKILLGEGLLTSEGKHHLRQRRLVQPAFHRERLVRYAAAMSECAVRWRERVQPGPMDIAREMPQLTLTIVAKTLFSADVASDAPEIGMAMTSVLEMFDLLLMPFAEYVRKLPLPSVRRFDKARARLDGMIYGLIEARRKSGIDTGDLLSMLLLAQDEAEDGGEDRSGMTDQQVRDEAITLFIAGHETTANALTWTWYLLAQHPEVEQRLHEEIDAVLGDKPPELSDVPQLRYAEMIFAEAMRLYPPAWAVGRRALAPFTVGGFDVPAGSICIMSQYIIHRDARWFPNPEKFDPERWRGDAREARPKFSYFPFGGGTRVCIGERFAWMEGVILMAAIAQKWRFRLAPGQHVEPLPLVTLRVKNGLRVIAEARAQTFRSSRRVGT